MALERKWLTITPVPFTADGTALGLVTVADTIYFKDKGLVQIKSSTIPTAQYQIKQVLSKTQFIVGPVDNNLNITNCSNISAYKVAEGAVIGSGLQDKLAQPSDKDHYFAIYESSPTNADRIIPVDPYGNFYTIENPVPVTVEGGSISIGQVEVIGTNGNIVEPNPDGSINVVVESSTPPSQEISVIYNEAASVPTGPTYTLLTYTIPLGNKASLQRVIVSGENIAKYDITVNGSTIGTQRTYFGGALNAVFDFSTSNGTGVLLNAGDVVNVLVLNTRPWTAEFESTLELIFHPMVANSQKTVATYNEVLSVASGSLTNVVTYVVPLGHSANLQKVIVSGENIAKYTVLVNSNPISVQRTYFGGELNSQFDFLGAYGGGLPLIEGDIVTVTVIHNRPSTANFESTIEVIEI